MKTLFTIIAALVCLSTQAEVVIYKHSTTDTASGNGKVATKKYGGWMVFDTDTYELRSILTQGKTFTEGWTSAEIHILTTGANKFTLWAAVPLFDTGGASFKGACTVQKIGTANLFYIPKTLACKGVAFESVGVLHEFAGSATMESKATIAANKAGQDIDDVVDALKNGLTLKGYVETF